MIRIVVLIAILLAASPAAAHPGHGETVPAGHPLHAIAEPVHLVPWVLAMIGGLLLLYRILRVQGRVASVAGAITRKRSAQRPFGG